MGRDSVVNTRCFDGLVDDVRIYNRALTAQEILDLVP
ncbi:MAG: LamG-like jellyroll fold domain-containing protein [Anaerohalosphaeraceae bacterium]